MTTTIEAMKQALAALDEKNPHTNMATHIKFCAQKALREAIAREEAQTAPPPFMQLTRKQFHGLPASVQESLLASGAPPPSAEREGMTPEKIALLFKANCVSHPGNYEVTPGQAIRIVRAVEAEMLAADAQRIAELEALVENWMRGYQAAYRDATEATVKCFQLEAQQVAVPQDECWCHSCRPITLSDMRMILCPKCGNKRCPHANDHRNACTASNEPGQAGSAYTALQARPARELTDAECNAFRRAAGSFNEMLRAVYAAGVAAQGASK